LVGISKGKRLLLTTRCRWEDNKTIDGADWTHLALNNDQWQALVNTVINLQVP
jgi:hypothetical protein